MQITNKVERKRKKIRRMAEEEKEAEEKEQERTRRDFLHWQTKTVAIIRGPVYTVIRRMGREKTAWQTLVGGGCD